MLPCWKTKRSYLIWMMSMSFLIVILLNSSILLLVHNTIVFLTGPTSTDFAPHLRRQDHVQHPPPDHNSSNNNNNNNTELFCVDPLIQMCNGKKRTGEKRNYVEENMGNEGYLLHIKNKKREYSTLLVVQQQDRNHDAVSGGATTTKTLALADPVLRDGYRNQVFRLTTFVKYALQHGFEEILLPSIRWQHEATRFDGERPYRIPFDLLFDVDHWNRQEGLPRLVEYNETLHYNWDPTLAMFRDVDCDVLDTYYNAGPAGKDIIMQRIRNVSATHPYGHGGGEQLGTLWFDYLSSSRHRHVSIELWNKSQTTFDAIETSVMNGLKPSLNILNTKSIQPLTSSSSPYLAVHPRVEPDMLKHPKCLEIKERNLTRIFELIRTFEKFQSVDNVLVAVNLDFMNHGSAPVEETLKNMHHENQQIFHKALSLGLQRQEDGHNNMTLFLAGKSALLNESGIPECSRSLAGSILNFALAVNADMFLGTHVSSWSVSVWKARFLQGRGEENYAITPTGIQKVIGMPQFHC